MTQIKKKRQYKNKTPGQDRDFETLSARRMFQAYEDVPANNTANVANWDHLWVNQPKCIKEKEGN